MALPDLSHSPSVFIRGDLTPTQKENLDKNIAQETRTRSLQEDTTLIIQKLDVYSWTAASTYQKPHQYVPQTAVSKLNRQHPDRVRTVSKDIEQISAVLHAYQDALNNASVEDAVKLYTQDGIVMPQHSPSFVGIANVRKAYESFFEIIKFDVKFDIQEVMPVSPEYAFARKQ